jgi:hypothetical protein
VKGNVKSYGLPKKAYIFQNQFLAASETHTPGVHIFIRNNN